MKPWDQLSPEEQETLLGKHVEFDEACKAHPTAEMLSGEALGEGAVATTLRTRNSQMTITDGPFAEAAEQADLALRAGDRSLARVSYEQALRMCTNEVERLFLHEKLQTLRWSTIESREPE